MNINRFLSKLRTTTLAISSLAIMFSVPAFARLDGAIFTTTPAGDIVNENVRYESKQEVFLDGGPGPNAPKQPQHCLLVCIIFKLPIHQVNVCYQAL